ncbi:Fur family transcriptional regulator [Bdellovibrio reynosensis]|uniref:Transcriptional repressor n=1 Tax=Bdellovibrio reynosensis TaxID=2835041 RepID=A0ABY4CAX7_9BACT|nr:Fur family transcriptional regulator [Bdellovibrio reynosensis]UOF01619.1 transcriptional repressor [Bdellovibrio reynosensis]
MKHCLSTAEIEGRLQAAGVQPTLQRIAICKFVLCEADHPSADDVKEWAEHNLGKISQATVYNTLNTLVDAGILKEFRFNHSDKVIYDCNTHDHFHFVDENTGKIYDINPEDVQLNISIPKKFKIKDVKLIFKGEVK